MLYPVQNLNLNAFQLLKYDHRLACIRILIYYIILKKLFYIHLKMNFLHILHYSCNMKLKNYPSANIYQYLQPTGERTTYVRSFYFFQTKKQRRVFVCNSSAAVRPAVIRHGARTRSQHRNFRERGQEGVSGWAKTSNYISLPPPLLFQKKIKRRHFEMRLILSWRDKMSIVLSVFTSKRGSRRE